MTIEVEAPRASTPGRLAARSSIAVADVELARHTLAELDDTRSGLEEAGRVLDRIRRLVVGGEDTVGRRI